MTATPAEGQTPEPKTVPEYLQEQQPLQPLAQKYKL